MNITELLGEDRAVSPVIGVILMVAITVILAAVIGTFVLGLGDQVSESAPQAQFTFDYNQTNSSVNATHDGGDPIPANTLTVAAPNASSSYNTTAYGSELTAGDTIEAAWDVVGGDTVRLVWSSSNSDKTATIAKFES